MEQERKIKTKIKPNTKTKKLIDLRKVTDPDNDIYICEYCDCRLIPYFDIKGERLTRGKLFQCGKCGLIKDTEMDNLQKPEALTSKGDTQDIFIQHWRQSANTKHKPAIIDPEPGNDDMLKAQGFHVVRTRVTVGGKILRDDYNHTS